MKHVRIAIALIGAMLSACGGESEPAVDSDAGDALVDAALADDVETTESFDDLPFGEFTTSLTAAEGSGKALCDAVITRILSDELANITISLSVIGESCDPTGLCESDDDRNGDFSYTGGVVSDEEPATMTLGYEPPGMTGRDVLWMYDTVLNPSPSSRFELLVDGDAYDIQSDDLQGIDDLGSGPPSESPPKKGPAFVSRTWNSVCLTSSSVAKKQQSWASFST